MFIQNPDFVEYLKTLSDKFKVKLVDKCMVLPANIGEGFIWGEKLPCGITVMVSDTVMQNCTLIEREASNEQYFTLQFNEETLPQNDTTKKNKRHNEELQSYVKLTDTLAAENFLFPSGKHLRSVKFFFNKSHLTNLLGKIGVDKILNHHFPILIANETLEPIATEYRMMLNELLTEKIEQPLRLNYIQNRVLMLLEKFILKLQARKNTAPKKLRRSDDETVRLMKVEALLVKDFSVTPPTIDELSRISAMSPTKLKNDFKALYGLPIYEYYQKNRMIKAKSLLMLGEYSIKEVGIMVGYSNLSHFANSFKKEFGFLPSEFASRDGVLVYNN